MFVRTCVFCFVWFTVPWYSVNVALSRATADGRDTGLSGGRDTVCGACQGIQQRVHTVVKPKTPPQSVCVSPPAPSAALHSGLLTHAPPRPRARSGPDRRRVVEVTHHIRECVRRQVIAPHQHRVHHPLRCCPTAKAQTREWAKHSIHSVWYGTGLETGTGILQTACRKRASHVPSIREMKSAYSTGAACLCTKVLVKTWCVCVLPFDWLRNKLMSTHGSLVDPKRGRQWCQSNQTRQSVVSRAHTLSSEEKVAFLFLSTSAFHLVSKRDKARRMHLSCEPSRRAPTGNSCWRNSHTFATSPLSIAAGADTAGTTHTWVQIFQEFGFG